VLFGAGAIVGACHAPGRESEGDQTDPNPTQASHHNSVRDSFSFCQGDSAVYDAAVPTLFLVRHGQASYGSPDYDQLSQLGERQSRSAGARLGREQPRISALYSGPRKRHRQTAQLLLETARAAGADYPDFTIVEELDELPVREIMLAAMPRPDEDLLAAVVDRVGRWARGELAPAGVVTPAEFMARIEGALARLLPAAGGPAVLVTSGGPIAVPLFRAAALSDVGQAFSRGLELANGSVSELARHGDGWRFLDGDPVAHLAPDEITKI
jgi:broad specificity phosphatase PhoE